MTENSLEQQMQVGTFRLYSQFAIGIATFFGAPLAAGILARRNFINLGKPQSGKFALLIGIFSTIFIFVGIFSLPDEIIDKVPNMVIPSIYTLIIYYVIEIYQGAALKEHKSNNRPFYSAWKAVGVGIASLAVIAVVVFGYIFLAPDDFDTKLYDAGIENFNSNENKALQLFSISEEDSSQVIYHIDSIAIPAFKENLTIISNLDNIEGLTEPVKKQNELLRKYSKLRIECFELIRKAFAEKTDEYNEQIDELNTQIDEIIEEL
jgi:hypothetical protein